MISKLISFGVVTVLTAVSSLNCSFSADSMVAVPNLGETATIQFLGVDSSGKILVDGSDAVELSSLRRIELGNRTTVEPTGKFVVYLFNGCELRGTEFELKDESMSMTTRLGKVDLPIEYVRAVGFDGKTNQENFVNALQKPNAEDDVLLVEVEGQVQPIGGVLESWNAEGISFDFDGEVRTVGIDQAVGLVFAGAGALNEKLGLRIQFVDKTSIFVKSMEWVEGEVTFDLFGLGEWKVPADSISSIDVNLGRLQFLSELTPDEVKIENQFAPDRSWRADQSVGQNPLTIRVGGKNQTFAKGLGTQSKSRMSFGNVENYSTLAGLVGLDAETNRRGDCVVRIVADEKVIFEQRLKGDADAIPFSFPIENARVISLEVDFGEHFDLADHVDWCDIRFVK